MMSENTFISRARKYCYNIIMNTYDLKENLLVNRIITKTRKSNIVSVNNIFKSISRTKSSIVIEWGTPQYDVVGILLRLCSLFKGHIREKFPSFLVQNTN